LNIATDRGGDERQKADPDEHQERGDEATARARWHVVSVADRRHRLYRPPHTIADVRELPRVGDTHQDPRGDGHGDRDRHDDPRRP
jgi:hypothetical protein